MLQNCKHTLMISEYLRRKKARANGNGKKAHTKVQARLEPKPVKLGKPIEAKPEEKASPEAEEGQGETGQDSTTGVEVKLVCPEHGTELKASKYGGYYCPHKDEDGSYCKFRLRDAEISFGEFKGRKVSEVASEAPGFIAWLAWQWKPKTENDETKALQRAARDWFQILKAQGLLKNGKGKGNKARSGKVDLESLKEVIKEAIKEAVQALRSEAVDHDYILKRIENLEQQLQVFKGELDGMNAHLASVQRYAERTFAQAEEMMGAALKAG